MNSHISPQIIEQKNKLSWEIGCDPISIQNQVLHFHDKLAYKDLKLNKMECIN